MKDLLKKLLKRVKNNKMNLTNANNFAWTFSLLEMLSASVKLSIL